MLESSSGTHFGQSGTKNKNVSYIPCFESAAFSKEDVTSCKTNVPCELSNLKPLESRLLCLRVLFTKMAALPTGKQRCMLYPWTSCECALQIVFNLNLLPRLPSQT